MTLEAGAARLGHASEPARYEAAASNAWAAFSAANAVGFASAAVIR